MNNTKWTELQGAMYELGSQCPEWRNKICTTGYISSWDDEWYYHFSTGGFKDIEWIELKIENDLQKSLVLKELKKIHVPGHETENGFRVYGYIHPGNEVNYLWAL